MKPTLILPLLTACGLTAAQAAPLAYQMNKDHTDVTFRINHADFSMKHGSFADISGTLQLDADRLEGSSVDVTVGMKSIYTSHAKRDEDLQGKGWLDVAQFPTMHFVSTKVTVVDKSNLDVSGDLTLHGVTRPLVLHAKINMIGKSPFGGVQAAGFSATGALKRSDYGMATMIPRIGDEISIAIDTEFFIPNK